MRSCSGSQAITRLPAWRLHLPEHPSKPRNLFRRDATAVWQDRTYYQPEPFPVSRSEASIAAGRRASVFRRPRPIPVSSAVHGTAQRSSALGITLRTAIVGSRSDDSTFPRRPGRQLRQYTPVAESRPRLRLYIKLDLGATSPIMSSNHDAIFSAGGQPAERSTHRSYRVSGASHDSSGRGLKIRLRR